MLTVEPKCQLKTVDTSKLLIFTSCPLNQSAETQCPHCPERLLERSVRLT